MDYSRLHTTDMTILISAICNPQKVRVFVKLRVYNLIKSLDDKKFHIQSDLKELLRQKYADQKRLPIRDEHSPKLRLLIPTRKTFI